ncbi:MAG: hypothetical protein NZ772_16710 [Cyanobacteria bacterium]|nr:hypothetical protein [Cyanobacteriota bacterium]MDW8202341.1 hypothetical protein [Cyanobacteriota bacterium SKYGB_h_bin112]
MKFNAAHEFSGRLIECFIRTLVELMGLKDDEAVAVQALRAWWTTL